MYLMTYILYAFVLVGYSSKLSKYH